MIFTSNITIRYLILSLIITVLTYDSTTNKKQKSVFTNIRIWLLSIIIILGVIELLLVIYWVWKYLKRRKRKEDEGDNKSVGRKQEINEQLDSTLSRTKVASNGSLTLVHDESEMDYDSLVNSRSQSSLRETVTEHDEGFVLKDKDSSTTIESSNENFSLTEVNEYTDSIRTSSEYKHDSESKENNEASQIESSSGTGTDVFEIYESSINTLAEVKTEKNEQSFSSQKEGQVIEKDQTIYDRNNSCRQEEYKTTPIKKATGITGKVISGENKKPNFQEQMSEEMSTSKILKKEITSPPVEEEDTDETFMSLNYEKDESTMDSDLIKNKEEKNTQEFVSEQDIVKEKVVTQYLSENSTLDTEVSEPSTVSGTLNDELKIETQTSKEHLNSQEYSASVKTINEGIRKNRRKRKFSRINSTVWKKTRKNLDIESSEK